MKYGIDVGHEWMVVYIICSILPAHISVSTTCISYKLIENIALNVTMLTIFFMAHPVNYSINARSIFADIELSYDTKNKW